jgi:glycosyltransferase involved in cell wall biosynthesis
MRIALCLLTLNERPSLERMFPRIPRPGPVVGFDTVFAMDGGSTDGTVEYFADAGVPIVGQSRRGRGAAMRQALQATDADAVIFFSPDGNEDPADLPRFRPLLEMGADIVIASRMMRDAYNEEDDQFLRWRKWANLGFNWLANVSFGRRAGFVTDSINGYRAVRKSVLGRLALDADDFTIEYQMTIRALKRGLNVVEFPTHEGHRIAGETGARSLPTGIRFLNCYFKELGTGKGA